MAAGGKRIAWVTGGGSGIGQAGAEALAADGWTVIVSGRRRNALDEVVRIIDARDGGRAEAVELDVSRSADVEAAAGRIVDRHGRIDLLVNSAGINVPKRSWEDMEIDGWDRLVDINLNGVLYCMRAVLPAMRAQRDGCIINVSSWAGRHGSKMSGPAYTTTKHAVLALTHSFNMDECVNGLRGLLPVAGGGGDADPQAAARGADRRGAGAHAAAGGSRPHHRLRRRHVAACLRQRDPHQPDLESQLRGDGGPSLTAQRGRGGEAGRRSRLAFS